MGKIRYKIVALGYIIAFSILISFIYANTPGSFEQNVTVKVNVTNAYPVIWDMNINPSPINLIAGGITPINCTVFVYDWNGFGDMIYLNATLWDDDGANMSDDDSNLTHYTNTNCSTYTDGPGAYNRTFYCPFNITYYANASTNWICNATVIDNYNFTDSEINTTTINPLYAINVSSEIDFGEAILGDIIQNKTANITNFGNKPINISVEGYGISLGDGLAMDCTTQGNITIENLKFSTIATDYASATTLLSTQQNISGLTIPQIDLVGVQPGEYLSTYWHLYVNPVNNPTDLCTGTIVFTAWNSN